MTLPEVAEYLRVSKDLIYRLAQKGKIPASKVGNQWRFKKEKIDEWMEEQQHSSSERKRGTRFR
jgi:excisionase family DNA binding protein